MGLSRVQKRYQLSVHNMANTKTITIRLPESLRAKLPKNYSSLIRKLLREYLAK